jgi:molecular chaperone HtpG
LRGVPLLHKLHRLCPKTTTAPAEKHPFQAEIRQLLEIVIHSLYTDKEIFVRELISNAADATEKLKFLQTSGTEMRDPDAALKITVSTDDQAKTITFTDAGGGTYARRVDREPRHYSP